MGFDEILLKVLVGSSQSKPTDLVGLVSGVDWLDRTVLYCSEMNEALRPLVESGKVVQSGENYWLSPRPGPTKFVPIEKDTYNRAVERYRKEFAEAYAALKAKDATSGKS